MSARIDSLRKRLETIEAFIAGGCPSAELVAGYVAMVAALRLEVEVAGDIPTQHATMLVANDVTQSP